MVFESGTPTYTGAVWPRWVALTGADVALTTINSTATTTITGGTIQVWQAWNDNSTTTITTTAGAATSGTWQLWVTDSAATTTTGPIWYRWTSDQEAGAAQRVRQAPAIVDPRVEAEAARRRAEDQERWRQQDLERQQKDREARERAERLLRSILTAEQNADLDKRNCFFVRGCDTGKLYRIDRGKHGNVKVVADKDAAYTESLCASPVDQMPDADAMLAQKLLLETAENAYRAQANITYRLPDGNTRYEKGRPERLTGERLAEIIDLRQRAAA